MDVQSAYRVSLLNALLAKSEFHVNTPSTKPWALPTCRSCGKIFRSNNKASETRKEAVVNAKEKGQGDSLLSTLSEKAKKGIKKAKHVAKSVINTVSGDPCANPKAGCSWDENPTGKQNKAYLQELQWSNIEYEEKKRVWLEYDDEDYDGPIYQKPPRLEPKYFY